MVVATVTILRMQLVVQDRVPPSSHCRTTTMMRMSKGEKRTGANWDADVANVFVSRGFLALRDQVAVSRLLFRALQCRLPEAHLLQVLWFFNAQKSVFSKYMRNPVSEMFLTTCCWVTKCKPHFYQALIFFLKNSGECSFVPDSCLW